MKTNDHTTGADEPSSGSVYMPEKPAVYRFS